MPTRVASRKKPEAEPASEVLGPGTVLGRYALQRPLAAGGMAQVWVATQSGALGFRKTVALKTIRPDRAHDATFREMFLDEARLASRIHHANVVEVLDLGIEGTIVFQAMPLVAGAALSALVRKLEGGRMPLRFALRVLLDMLRGLHAAHELCDDDGAKLGLVHRDVSPQNVLVGIDGVAKLSDFGIAKAFGRIAEETEAGAVRGKLRYLAPEVLEGLPPSPQSDLFACGVMLWELMTGTILFAAESSTELVAARKDPPPLRDPREIVPDLPPRLAEIAMRALASHPFARFSTAREMSEAIEEAMRGRSLASTQEELGDWVGRVLERRSADAAPMLGSNDLVTATTTTNVTLIDEASTTNVLSVSHSAPPAPAAPSPRARSPLAAGAAIVLVSLVGFIATRRTTEAATAPVAGASAPPPAPSVEPVVAAPEPTPSPVVSATTHASKPRLKKSPAPASSATTPGGAIPVFRNPY